MTKYFVAYRSTGEDPKTLEARMNAVADAFKRAKADAYCNFFDSSINGLTSRQKMEKAFERIDGSDVLFVLIASNDKSEGQLMEVGYACAKGKHIIAAIHQDVTTYIDQMADETIRWRDLDDLSTQLQEVAG